MCIEENPKICPKPCPSVSFCLKPDKIEETDSKDSFAETETETESFQNENTFFCREQEHRLNLGNHLVVLKLNLII